MKNKEVYKEELIKSCKVPCFSLFFEKYIVSAYNCWHYEDLTEETRIILTMLWLDEEYQAAEVDWSKVSVDTPILVSTNGRKWVRKYFAEYCDGTVYAFKNGATSWTTNLKTGWEYAKLVELQNSEHDGCIGCKYEHFEENQEPCKDCQYAHMDRYEPKEEIK